jgi:hypothetical protein
MSSTGSWDNAAKSPHPLLPGRGGQRELPLASGDDWRGAGTDDRATPGQVLARRQLHSVGWHLPGEAFGDGRHVSGPFMGGGCVACSPRCQFASGAGLTCIG